MRFAVLCSLLVALAGCGGHQPPRIPAYSADGRAVLRDAYDGRLDRDWACGSLWKAIERLPPGGGPMFSTLPGEIRRAAGDTCDAAVASIRRSLTKARVDAQLGPPDVRGPLCWRYTWPPVPSSALDGLRVCFTAGRVGRIQTAIHA